MNGIGNAFIWTAISCGPIFLIVLGVMTFFLPRWWRQHPADSAVPVPRSAVTRLPRRRPDQGDAH